MRQIIYIFGLFLTGHVAYGQDIQGYIDYDKVVVTLPQYQQEQKILKVREKQLGDSIATMAKNFQRLLEETPHNIKMDSASKASLEAKLNEFQKKIGDAQNHAQTELMGMK